MLIDLSDFILMNLQHEGIIDFPSKNSYEGRVLSGTMGQRQPSVLNWPAGRTKPVAFCKLKGSQSYHSLDIGTPKEETICNIDQADFAVSYFYHILELSLNSKSAYYCRTV